MHPTASARRGPPTRQGTHVRASALGLPTDDRQALRGAALRPGVTALSLEPSDQRGRPRTATDAIATLTSGNAARADARESRRTSCRALVIGRSGVRIPPRAPGQRTCPLPSVNDPVNDNAESSLTEGEASGDPCTPRRLAGDRLHGR